MSVLDEASLVLIPSGYKASKLYSVVPSSGDGDLDFTRSTTATRVNESGLIETVGINVPRIDFTGGGCGKALIEPQRTNLVTQSVNLSSWSVAVWTKTINSATAPDGTTTANLIEQATVGLIYADASTVDGTLSFFVKYNSAMQFFQILGHGDSNTYANFDILNGLVGNVGSLSNAEIKDYGNGWFRISMTILTGATLVHYRIKSVTSLTSPYNNSTNFAGSFYAWGAQKETGYPTSYIPTAGTSVTRGKDASSTSGLSSLINSVEGVLYLKSQALFNDLTNRSISISDGTANNSILIKYSSTTQTISADVIVAGVSQCTMTYAVADVTAIHKIAIRYKANDFSLWVDGVERATDASGSTFSAATLNTFSYDKGAGGDSFYGRVSEDVLAEYLTDTQMAALTTL